MEIEWIAHYRCPTDWISAIMIFARSNKQSRAISIFICSFVHLWKLKTINWACAQSIQLRIDLQNVNCAIAREPKQNGEENTKQTQQSETNATWANYHNYWQRFRTMYNTQPWIKFANKRRPHNRHRNASHIHKSYSLRASTYLFSFSPVSFRIYLPTSLRLM